PFGDVQHDGYGAQRLGQPAGAGGLLPDAAALQRPALVPLAGRLAADAELEEDGVGVRDGRVQVGGGGDGGRVVGAGEDAPGEPAHRLQPVLRRVGQDQFGDREDVPQPGEAVDELGG